MTLYDLERPVSKCMIVFSEPATKKNENTHRINDENVDE